MHNRHERKVETATTAAVVDDIVLRSENEGQEALFVLSLSSNHDIRVTGHGLAFSHDPKHTVPEVLHS